MEWGDKLEFLLEILEETGKPPKALRRRPAPLPEHLRWVWDAFNNLQSDRQLGFGGAGPIMWTSIDAYARRYGVSGDRFERFVSFIRQMDSIWLTHAAKEK